MGTVQTGWPGREQAPQVPLLCRSPLTPRGCARHRPRQPTAPRGTSIVHRYYDPATGEFLTLDPLVGTTTTPYVYAGADPVNAIDPDGLDCGWFSVVCGAYDATSGAVKGVGKSFVHGAATAADCISSAITATPRTFCFSPRGLANILSGAANTISTAAAGLLCLGDTYCPNWSIPAPFPCSASGSYQLGEGLALGLSALIPGGDEADGAGSLGDAAKAAGAGAGALASIHRFSGVERRHCDFETAAYAGRRIV
jgi:hypothetical protein